MPLYELSLLIVAKTLPLGTKNALLDLGKTSLVLQTGLGEIC